MTTNYVMHSHTCNCIVMRSDMLRIWFASIYNMKIQWMNSFSQVHLLNYVEK